MTPIAGKTVETFDKGATRETTRWVGKPWRRAEILTFDHFYKGEHTGRERVLSVTLASRRLGMCFHWAMTLSRTLDFSEERQ